jgi:purine-cytosine permease-like protein
LSEPPNRSLGFRDTLGLWGNLGISLLLPVAAAFVFLPGRPLLAHSTRDRVGAAIGSFCSVSARPPVPGEGVPAMVLLRGLLGRAVSYLPTVLNLVQCVGWATFEICIIAEAASRVAARAPLAVRPGRRRSRHPDGGPAAGCGAGARP